MTWTSTCSAPSPSNCVSDPGHVQQDDRVGGHHEISRRRSGFQTKNRSRDPCLIWQAASLGDLDQHRRIRRDKMTLLDRAWALASDRGAIDEQCSDRGDGAPAGHAVVGLDPASVEVAGADRPEHGPGRRPADHAIGIVAPAGHGVVGLDPAGVEVAGADRPERGPGRTADLTARPVHAWVRGAGSAGCLGGLLRLADAKLTALLAAADPEEAAPT